MCRAIAALLHYLFTASFLWMLIEGVHLYTKSVAVFGKGLSTKIYLLVGWGELSGSLAQYPAPKTDPSSVIITTNRNNFSDSKNKTTAALATPTINATTSKSTITTTTTQQARDKQARTKHY